MPFLLMVCLLITIDLVLLSCVKRLACTCGHSRSVFCMVVLVDLLCSLLNCSYIAMQHYAELPDIKRVIVNTHAIEPQVCSFLL
jgi:hypothetical protein